MLVECRVRVAAYRCTAACVVNFVVVVAVACSHLVHSQGAGLVAGDARCAAQRLDCLEVLDENVDVFHLDGGEGEGDGELRGGVTRSK